MDAIVAVYSDWGIGSEGTQPIVVPEDRRHFAKLTSGSGAGPWRTFPAASRSRTGSTWS